jgi:WXG100 family type VII secretion target
MTDLFSLDPEEMQKLSNEFEQESERIQRVRQNLQSDIDVLRRGGWIADAADMYYQHMDGDVMPSIDRLSRALQEASEVSRRIVELVNSADEEASSFLRSN